MTRDPVDARPTLLIAVNDAGFFLSHRLPIAKAAAKAGYDVHIAAMPGPHVESIVSLGFPFHPVPLSRRGTPAFAVRSTPFTVLAASMYSIGVYHSGTPVF